jgi:hypothetical protein
MDSDELITDRPLPVPGGLPRFRFTPDKYMVDISRQQQIIGKAKIIFRAEIIVAIRFDLVHFVLGVSEI